MALSGSLSRRRRSAAAIPIAISSNYWNSTKLPLKWQSKCKYLINFQYMCWISCVQIKVLKTLSDFFVGNLIVRPLKNFGIFFRVNFAVIYQTTLFYIEFPLIGFFPHPLNAITLNTIFQLINFKYISLLTSHLTQVSKFKIKSNSLSATREFGFLPLIINKLITSFTHWAVVWEGGRKKVINEKFDVMKWNFDKQQQHNHQHQVTTSLCYRKTRVGRKKATKYSWDGKNKLFRSSSSSYILKLPPSQCSLHIIIIIYRTQLNKDQKLLAQMSFM